MPLLKHLLLFFATGQNFQSPEAVVIQYRLINSFSQKPLTVYVKKGNDKETERYIARFREFDRTLDRWIRNWVNAAFRDLRSGDTVGRSWPRRNFHRSTSPTCSRPSGG